MECVVKGHSKKLVEADTAVGVVGVSSYPL